MQFVNLQRIKKSKNPEQAMRDFFYSKIEIERKVEPQVLGASKIGCCKFQAIKSICGLFNLGESN